MIWEYWEFWLGVAMLWVLAMYVVLRAVFDRGVLRGQSGWARASMNRTDTNPRTRHGRTKLRAYMGPSGLSYRCLDCGHRTELTTETLYGRTDPIISVECIYCRRKYEIDGRELPGEIGERFRVFSRHELRASKEG